MSAIAKAGLTSAGIMTVADILAQLLQNLGKDKSSTSSSRESGGFDLIRTVRFAVVGLTCHGPFFFAGFGWVDRLFGSPLGAGGSVMWKVLAKKVLTTQLILNPPYMVILFAWMGFLEGRRSVSTIVANVVAKWPAAFWMGNLFWPVANTINFRFLGPEYRVAYVAACGAVWNTYISWMNKRKDMLKAKRDADAKKERMHSMLDPNCAAGFPRSARQTEKKKTKSGEEKKSK